MNYYHTIIFYTSLNKVKQTDESKLYELKQLKIINLLYSVKSEIISFLDVDKRLYDKYTFFLLFCSLSYKFDMNNHSCMCEVEL